MKLLKEKSENTSLTRTKTTQDWYNKWYDQAKLWESKKQNVDEPTGPELTQPNTAMAMGRK